MRTYEVVFSDIAQDEADQSYLTVSRRVSPDFALRWYNGLVAEVRERLSSMPRVFALAPDASAFPGLYARKMPYGRGATAYRVLYHVVEPAAGAEDEPGTVVILRVGHAARRLLTDAEREDDEG
ncbi:MAG TPA: hypothetical protein VM490_25890 [Armatimonadaceae bacterium]|nr:hypothetical protein [Armatimonadaceae bacterium]